MDGRELFFRPVYLPYPKEIDVVGQIGTNESVVVFCEKLPKDVGDALRNQGVSYITHWDMCSSVLLDYRWITRKQSTCQRTCGLLQPTSYNLLTTKRSQMIGMFWRIQR